MDILKFITAGSVDDGKSTLIGRLLYDSKSILADQLEAIEKSSKNKLNGTPDLALLTDGLRAEREQGITIDVAYRYFSTPNRKFIIADAPGHVQYTRNMITGASNSDLVIILIDARQGVVEQTRRHSIIAALLGIPNVVVAINKIDLVDYDEKIYNQIVATYQDLAQKLGLENVYYIPISALLGDNIVEKSTATPWFKGQTLLDYLETIPLNNTIDLTHARFKVQYVIRPQTPELHDYRGYAGKIYGGTFAAGDKIKVLPNNLEATIDQIEIAGKPVETAFAPQSVTILLKEDIDISRGTSFVKENDDLQLANEMDVLICWLDEKPLQAGNKYLLQQHSTTVRAVVKNLEYKIDVNSLAQIPNIDQLKLNEVVKAKLKTATPLAFDSYKNNKFMGSAILIDETSNNTVAAVLFQ